MARRNICNFVLTFNDVNTSEILIDVFDDLCDYILAKAPIERKFNLSGDSFCLMDYGIRENNVFCIKFKSAHVGYRAPLLDKNTVKERENPKTINEGDMHLTHLIISFDAGNNEGNVFIESSKDLVSMKKIVDYFNLFLSELGKSLKLEAAAVLGDDFMGKLTEMSRVSVANIIIDKKILGHEALNYSGQTEHIKDEIELSVKSKKNCSILEYVKGLYDSMITTNSIVKRIRVKGKQINGCDVVLDSDFLLKKMQVDVDKNDETGEFDSKEMFSKLKLLIE